MIQNKIWRWPLACALAFSAAAWSEAVSLERNQAEVQAVTFKNPVVWADVPDPDVLPDVLPMWSLWGDPAVAGAAGVTRWIIAPFHGALVPLHPQQHVNQYKEYLLYLLFSFQNDF